MHKNELDQELLRLRELIETVRNDSTHRNNEPTLKDFSRWLSSQPEWSEDGGTTHLAKRLDKVISAFLCQGA